MQIDAWLKAALADAADRGLIELEPLLVALARATRILRAASWNAEASGDPGASTPELR